MDTLIESFLLERRYRQPQRQRVVHGKHGHEISKRVGRRNGRGLTAAERHHRSEAARKRELKLKTVRRKIIRKRLRTFQRRKTLGLDRRRIAGHHK